MVMTMVCMSMVMTFPHNRRVATHIQWWCSPFVACWQYWAEMSRPDNKLPLSQQKPQHLPQQALVICQPVPHSTVICHHTCHLSDTFNCHLSATLILVIHHLQLSATLNCHLSATLVICQLHLLVICQLHSSFVIILVICQLHLIVICQPHQLVVVWLLILWCSQWGTAHFFLMVRFIPRGQGSLWRWPVFTYMSEQGG